MLTATPLPLTAMLPTYVPDFVSKCVDTMTVITVMFVPGVPAAVVTLSHPDEGPLFSDEVTVKGMPGPAETSTVCCFVPNRSEPVIVTKLGLATIVPEKGGGLLLAAP